MIVNDSVTREAITREQERAFLEFVKQDKHFRKYYEDIYILFKTGLRISEFVGLTISDIDLEKGVINVNHQLQRKHNMEYIIAVSYTHLDVYKRQRIFIAKKYTTSSVKFRRDRKIILLKEGYSLYQMHMAMIGL